MWNSREVAFLKGATGSCRWWLHYLPALLRTQGVFILRDFHRVFPENDATARFHYQDPLITGICAWQLFMLSSSHRNTDRAAWKAFIA
jgi:hypothetical protein